MLKTLFFLFQLIAFHKLQASSTYIIKYNSNNQVSIDTVFDSQQRVLAKERINHLRCFMLCESLNNCAFVVFTAFNSSYSTCNIYKTLPELNKQIFITTSKVMSQKVAYKLVSYSTNLIYTELNVTYKLKASFEAHKSNYVNCLLKLDNEDIASSDTKNTSIKIWSNYTLKFVLVNPNASITSLAYLGDKKVANGGADGFIRIWNLNSTDSTLIGSMQSNSNSYRIFYISLANNGDIVSGSTDNSIKIWYSANFTLKRVLKYKAQLTSIALLPDGSLAIGLGNGSIIISDLENGTLKANMESHTNKVSSLLVLYNGNLASASFDFSIKIWDTASYLLKMTLIGHTSNVLCLCDLFNGYFASGSDDKLIKVWSLSTGLLKQNLTGHGAPVNTLATLLNGTFASGSNDGFIKVWYPVY